MGPMTTEEIRAWDIERSAYHEAGHAVSGLLLGAVVDRVIVILNEHGGRDWPFATGRTCVSSDIASPEVAISKYWAPASWQDPDGHSSSNLTRPPPPPREAQRLWQRRRIAAPAHTVRPLIAGEVAELMLEEDCDPVVCAGDYWDDLRAEGRSTDCTRIETVVGSILRVDVGNVEALIASREFRGAIDEEAARVIGAFRVMWPAIRAVATTTETK